MTRKQRIQKRIADGMPPFEAVQAECPDANVVWVEWYITHVLPNKPKKKASREKQLDKKFNYAESVVKREVAGG